MSLIYLSCAWVIGIYLGSRFNLPFALILVGLAPLPLLLLTRQHRKAVILSGLCLAALFGAIFYFPSGSPAVDDSQLGYYHDRGALEIRGLVARDPESGDRTARLHLSAREIRVAGEWREVTGAVLLFVPRYPVYRYGDSLLVVGELHKPSQLGDFDYEKYLAHQEIYSTMLYPEVLVLERGGGAKPLEWVYSLRNRLSQNLAEALAEPQASLAQGIILGKRANIPLSVKSDFTNSGTAHLLAISGLHLAIVAGMLLSFGIWLFGRQGYGYIWLALGAIWLYALLTGGQAPVLRAAIMASLFLTAELVGRQRSAATALFLAAAVMVGVSPHLLWTASFQMSFMAMAGLIYVFPGLQYLARKAVTAWLGENGAATSVAILITDSFSVTLGALVAIWPLIAYYFGIVSWVAPLATLFALPALPGIIVLGTVAGVLGFIALPLAQVVGWLGWLALSYLLVVVRLFGAVAPLRVDSFDSTVIWVYYSILALLISVYSHRERLVRLMPGVSDWLKSGAGASLSVVSRWSRKWVLLPLLPLAVLAWLAVAVLPDDNLHVTILDVGQGEAILIQRGSQQVLVDGGPSPQAVALALGERMPFWDKTIDLVVLTHPHADHVTGLLEVLKRYQVKRVLYPHLSYDSPLSDEWLSLVADKSIEASLAQAGQQVRLGEVVIEVLAPGLPLLTGTGSDVDNNGVVLRLGMGEVSFLFTADIQREAELELMARRASVTSTVLKVAHHGSDTSTTPEFLAVVNPRLAVISVGQGNDFGHPTAEVVGRLEQKVGVENIYRTDEQSSIEFITDGRRLWVKVKK